jgi:aryl-alcohol dehydrogenase-like predicted oxidoreductase
MSGYLPPHTKGGSASELYGAQYELKKSDITAGDSRVQGYDLRIPKGVIPTTKTLIRLGDADLKFQPIGFGLWGWGDVLSYGWGPSNGYDQKLNDQSIHAAWEKIFRNCDKILLDTAEHYGYTDGYSERKVGDFWEKSQKEGLSRSRFTFATKYFPTPWRHPWRYPSIVLESLNGSLDRSKVGWIDIYQLHGPSHWGFWPRMETLCNGLAEGFKTGKCKAIGTCNLSFEQVQYVYTYMKKVSCCETDIALLLTSFSETSRLYPIKLSSRSSGWIP